MVLKESEKAQSVLQQHIKLAALRSGLQKLQYGCKQQDQQHEACTARHVRRLSLSRPLQAALHSLRPVHIGSTGLPCDLARVGTLLNGLLPYTLHVLKHT